ncbi:MAG: CRISPR-associated endoribonuclease Cas2 [Acidimicrobiales bacterium]|nr:MAG: CRISPR-associated endoribonuclease Cas2 [Acidimicrobiales bacterium]
MDILVTYDIATDTREGERRLATVAAICERYGIRVQYSVFECRLPSHKVLQLMDELRSVIDFVQDSVRIYRIESGFEKCCTCIGRDQANQWEPWIL